MINDAYDSEEEENKLREAEEMFENGGFQIKNDEEYDKAGAKGAWKK